MINNKNYYETIQSKGLKKTDLPMTLWKGWDFVDKVSLGGDSWTTYDSSEPIKKGVDLYFVKFGEFIGSKKSDSKTNVKKNPSKTKFTTVNNKNEKRSKAEDEYNEFVLALTAIIEQLEDDWSMFGPKFKTIETDLKEVLNLAKRIEFEFANHKMKETLEKMNILRHEIHEESDEDWYGLIHKVDTISTDLAFSTFPFQLTKKKKDLSVEKKSNRPKRVMRPSINSNAKKVEALSIELKFLKRYVNLHNKKKTRSQIRLFISALQKAIRERKITKTSEFAKEIIEMQSALITLHGSFKNDKEEIVVTISEKRLAKILPVLGKQIQMPSVKFIKSYITLQGKLITNKQAHSLHTRIIRAYNAGKITKRDKYWKELESIMDQLATFIEKNPNQGLLRIESRALNGLSGIVLGCPCDQDALDGFDTIPERTIMNSMDIIKLNFKKLDFKGKWREFIGNPSKGFSAMIFAKPKMGKSYLSVDWAGYLANNHGAVLYVAKEEGIDETLQMKLREKAVIHPDFYVSNYLPEDLSKYDFVFLDSITKLKLTPSDLAVMEANYPNISFISIFQVTKSGNFRGNNGFQHEVDVVIEIPEKGKAIQYGRFNQGGEMDVFDDMVA